MNLLSKIFQKLRRLCVALAVLVVAGACDELQTDVDLPAVSIGNFENTSFLVYANTETFIPITSYITSPIRLKIQCTPKPTLGYVETMPDGNFKYTPFINAVGTDVVTFTIHDAATDEEVLPPQAVTVIIQETERTYDCQYIPVVDVVTPWDLHSNRVTIDPIPNDEACPGTYRLSVYRPLPSSMPRFGTASVVASPNSYYMTAIEYRPDEGILTRDTIMYKIMNNDDPGDVQYGLIVISPRVCELALRDDFASLYAPNESIIINLYENDEIFCGPSTEWPRVEFAQLPRHGRVEMYTESGGPLPAETGPGFIIYQSLSTERWGYDSVVYKVCPDFETCYTAKLIISAEANSCAISAADDHIIYQETSNGKVDIEVLTNDETCGLNPKLSVKTPPQHGAIEVDERNGRFIYKPKYLLNDSFEYFVCANRSCKAARVYIAHKQ